MRIHPEATINRLKSLRRKGHSIEQLVRELSMPKTTVWHHIHNIKLPKKYILQLKANQGGSRLRKERDIIRAENEAKLLLRGKAHMAYAVISTLYWAEGSKKRCEFVNTDGEMIKLYLKIVRKYLRIPGTRIQPVLRIFSNHNADKSLRFWSQTTKIPKDRFKILLNDGGTSGRTPYGMCRIIILRGGYLLKLFKALSVELCRSHGLNAPIAQVDRAPQS